jgi:hypothetical protein
MLDSNFLGTGPAGYRLETPIAVEAVTVPLYALPRAEMY